MQLAEAIHDTSYFSQEHILKPRKSGLLMSSCVALATAVALAHYFLLLDGFNFFCSTLLLIFLPFWIARTLTKLLPGKGLLILSPLGLRLSTTHSHEQFFSWSNIQYFSCNKNNPNLPFHKKSLISAQSIYFIGNDNRLSYLERYTYPYPNDSLESLTRHLNIWLEYFNPSGNEIINTSRQTGINSSVNSGYSQWLLLLPAVALFIALNTIDNYRDHRVTKAIDLANASGKTLYHFMLYTSHRQNKLLILPKITSIHTVNIPVGALDSTALVFFQNDIGKNFCYQIKKSCIFQENDRLIVTKNHRILLDYQKRCNYKGRMSTPHIMVVECAKNN